MRARARVQCFVYNVYKRFIMLHVHSPGILQNVTEEYRYVGRMIKLDGAFPSLQKRESTAQFSSAAPFESRSRFLTYKIKTVGRFQSEGHGR